MTRSRTYAEVASSKFLLPMGALLVSAGVAIAAPPAQKPRPSASAATAIDSEFRAAYPMSMPTTAPQLAGVRLAQLVLPGLQLSERSDSSPTDGGIVLSYVDRAGSVRVLIRVAVTADASAAQKHVDTELHGVSTQLVRASDAALGDPAWADDGGQGTSLVVAAHGNIAYSVNVVDGTAGVPSAARIASMVRAAMIPGAPVFPVVSLALPQVLEPTHGAAVAIAVPSGLPYKLRADGAYIARGPKGQLVRPFAAGPIAVHATVADELGRVTVATARATAAPASK